MSKAKTTKVDGILMLSGKGISFISSIISMVIFSPFMFEKLSYRDTLMSTINIGISIVSFFGGVLFAVGLLLLFLKIVNITRTAAVN